MHIFLLLWNQYIVEGWLSASREGRGFRGINQHHTTMDEKMKVILIVVAFVACAVIVAAILAELHYGLLLT